MAPYQLILAYDGTSYLGFQRQNVEATVQGKLEAALRQLGWKENSILAAGRTDAGVHASGQVVQINLDWKHSTLDLCNAINTRLPEDISVRSVVPVEEGSHPRYDAVTRTYRYQVFCEPVRNPLKERFSWRIWPELELDLLQEAAAVFIGTHDFCAFGSPVRQNGSTIRTIYESSWADVTGMLNYTITANAFLYHMVRRVVYQQVLVASRKLQIEKLRSGLSGKELDNYGLAPAHGLILEKVSYKDFDTEV